VEQHVERPVLAVDLGGTQIRAALVAPDRTVHHRRAVPTDDEAGIDSVLERMLEVVAAVRAAAAADGLPEPIGLGIASPGPLDPVRGVVLDPPNLRGWRDVSVVERVGAQVDLPVFLERDTNVAVMAEWRHGVAAGTADAIYVTVSTGVGGGVISGGRPLVGRDRMAGEVGHLVVDADGPVCGCGGIGHVEAIASGTALARSASALLEADGSPGLARLARAGEPVDAKMVGIAAEAGDPAATQLLERAWTAVGALCVSLVNLLNPEIIVIGGGIAEHHPRLFDVARRDVARHSLRRAGTGVRIERPAFGPNVSLVGLLPIVNDRIGDPAFGARSQASPPATVVQGATSS
jgi:glucokinase